MNASAGNDSVALGGNANTNNQAGSVALGNTAIVNSGNQIVIGYTSTASGTGTIAIGSGASGASTGVVMGYQAGATGSNATVVGYQAGATSTNGTAIGYTAEASTGGTALGYDARATNTNATAVGFGADATGTYTVAIGSSADASSNYGIAIGANATASADYEINLGSIFTYNGSSLITLYDSTNIRGGLTVEGNLIGDVSALSIVSSTASMDCSAANFFTLTLGNGVDTHLDATNIQTGQTINLKVTNNATSAGTISFAPEFKFPDGTAFAATATTSAVDILTFISFDGSTLESTGLKNFS